LYRYVTGLGKMSYWESDLGGFGLTVFVWALQFCALLFLGIAACTKSELSGGGGGGGDGFPMWGCTSVCVKLYKFNPVDP
jgi:hypothetical protein